MKIPEFFKILDELQHKIFMDLDKAGNYSRVDEGTARSIVEKHIQHTKSKYDFVAFSKDEE